MIRGGELELLIWERNVCEADLVLNTVMNDDEYVRREGW